MSETEKPFTVSDRRHFTPEGRPRDDEPAASVAAAPPASAPHPTEEPQQAAPAQQARRPAAGPMDFRQFLLSLGAQAGLLLSGAGQPSGEAEALEAARSLISILEMLEDKTQGRRTPDEDQVLEGLLFELRMTYVERTRAVRP